MFVSFCKEFSNSLVILFILELKQPLVMNNLYLSCLYFDHIYYCFCILGSNGAGKTTLMRILCGLDSQYGGKISLTAADKNNPTPDDTNADSKREGLDNRAQMEGKKGGGLHRTEDMEIEFDISKSHDIDHLNRASNLQQFRRGPQERQHDRPQQSGSLISLALRWVRIGVQYLIKISSKVNGFIKFKFTDVNEENKLRRCVGWCPQEDALFDYLTVSEHIELFDALLGGSTYMDIGSGEEDDKEHREDKDKGDRDQGSSREGFNHDVSRRMDLIDLNNQDIDEPNEAIAENRKWSLNSVLSYLRSFFSPSKPSNYDESSTLVLSRLGMLEHADKYVLALSGTIGYI
jgi:ABC-type cobalamin/Fe3+-siderophores transport system ATPase subunit